MIFAVIPTNRPERLTAFLADWREQFAKHKVNPVIVRDGDRPVVDCGKTFSVRDVMGKNNEDLIFNHNDGIRNLGIAFACQRGAETIISLDDDTEPFGDTIGDHIAALKSRHPTGWINTANEVYMRGFPYKIRDEAECVLSHGVWRGVPDVDAATQIISGVPDVTLRKMPVPRGVLFPMCAMNVAIKRKLVPYFYQAPMFGDINRFADIWCGIETKKMIDEKGWCAVTGYSTVIHDRASDPFVNLFKESKGLMMNEHYGEGEYFKRYSSLRKRWEAFIYSI